MLDVASCVTRGTVDGAGAIGTNLVICGIVIGDCIVESVGIVLGGSVFKTLCTVIPDGDTTDCMVVLTDFCAIVLDVDWFKFDDIT